MTDTVAEEATISDDDLPVQVAPPIEHPPLYGHVITQLEGDLEAMRRRADKAEKEVARLEGMGERVDALTHEVNSLKGTVRDLADSLTSNTRVSKEVLEYIKDVRTIIRNVFRT